jgi:hypothetical protein
MSLGLKLTVGSWVALVVAVILYFFGMGTISVDATSMIFLLCSGVASLFGLICTGLSIAACVFICKEKSFDTVKLVISIAVSLLCCGPVVPVVLLLIPTNDL